MSDERTYDVVVVGAGPTGENVADRAVKGGLSAVIVEAGLVGGDCSYWACMPSKALLRPTQALRAAQRVAGAAPAASGHIDTAAVLRRRDGFAAHWDDSAQVGWLREAGIDLVRGHGRLAGARRVEVGTATGTVVLLARRAVVLATGSLPSLPPVPGLAGATPWTTRESTSAQATPERLVVIGGGAAGCELAQAWAGLGSRVTLLEAAGRLLPTHEPVAGEMLAAAMAAQGVDARTGAEVSAASRASDGGVVVQLADGAVVEGDELLVAAGRRPRSEDLGLSSIGLRPGGWLEVDDTMAVRAVPGDWLYAAGDLNGRALLTHQGKYQARACGDAIVARAGGTLVTGPWSRHSATADHVAVPQVVFTNPEVASVGLTAAEAGARGVPVEVVDHPLGQVAGAALRADGYEGHARLVVDEARQVVVGATFVGQDVAELLHAATVAIVAEVPLARLWHAVPSYPTVSEIWLRLLEGRGM